MTTTLPNDALAREVNRRRTFGIISHPDAGKTTLTEKLLLFGGAIREAGEIKARGAERHARSDWLDMEQERGISVTSSVMKFTYNGREINLLDTPGHKDFSEDTYRVLTAVDSVIMIIDNASGVEAQTEKLMDVCRMRATPIITFINKMDRYGLEPLELLSDIEEKLDIDCAPLSWPIGMGREFAGSYNLYDHRLNLFGPSGVNGVSERIAIDDLDDPQLDEALGSSRADQLRFEVELITEAGNAFDLERYLSGRQTPVFFGSALNTFGVEELLDTFVEIAPAPRPRPTSTREVSPYENDFSGLVFKIQANMDENHRDRIAFVRVCSGRFERGMRIMHQRSRQEVGVSNATMFMAREREGVEEAFPGDIIGIHNHGTIKIGDTFTEKEAIQFTGVPSFAPEHFRKVVLDDPFRAKHLGKGLKQLSEEGAVQVYRPAMGSAYLLGAVGVLQFDVTLARLDAEYNVSARLAPVEWGAARWISCDDADTLKAFSRKNEQHVHTDAEGDLVYLAKNDWWMQRAIDQNPDIAFQAMKHH